MNSEGPANQIKTHTTSINLTPFGHNFGEKPYGSNRMVSKPSGKTAKLNTLEDDKKSIEEEPNLEILADEDEQK